MVKVPEKFLDEYLKHEKTATTRSVKRTSKVQMREISNNESLRLKRNLQILWDIYKTPEIRGILSKKHQIHFLDINGANVRIGLSYVDKGILMEYESNMGAKKELAGARLYNQDKVIINRYFASGKGLEALLKTSHIALKTMADVMIENEFSEMSFWNAIKNGEQAQILA